MYVTNNVNTNLGIHGPIVLAAHEKNRFIDDDNKVLVEAIMRLKAANLVSISKGPGLKKTVTTTAVKPVAVKAEPKASKMEEPKVEVKVEEPKVTVEDVVATEEVKEEVAEAVEETVVEAPAEEQVVEDAEKSNKKKKKK